MHLYRCSFFLASIMYYDVFDRTQPESPPPYLHNDLLAYACQWAEHQYFFPSLADRERHYVEYLSEVNDLALYITPGAPARFAASRALIDYDPTGRTFGRSHPREVDVVDPGAIFEAYLISEQPVVPFSKRPHTHLRVLSCLNFEWWRSLQDMPVFDVEGEELPAKGATQRHLGGGSVSLGDGRRAT